ncbi:hypothetical protein BDD14_2753 [Edaphobacter modestus]|uniref:Uncharacterized protein n=1 Tax=Edaphobacter modestus TaxID=388466 RepID=A0A4V6MFU8_9BACT|nr:hypothetical protein BDD14_2753 [Edaphobacter modestus]
MPLGIRSMTFHAIQYNINRMIDMQVNQADR